MTRIRTSSHAVAAIFLNHNNFSIRGFILGKLTVLWDGKPSDLRETVPTSVLISEREGVARD